MITLDILAFCMLAVSYDYEQRMAAAIGIDVGNNDVGNISSKLSLLLRRAF